MENAACILPCCRFWTPPEKPSILPSSVALLEPKVFEDERPPRAELRDPKAVRTTIVRTYSQVQRGTRMVSRKQEVRMWL